MHLSTLGWIILIVFLVFVLSLNLSLIFALRKKSKDSTWMDQIKKSSQTLSDPWKEENERFANLASKVRELKNNDRKDANLP